MSAQREHIVLFTDGAASGNPGPGGWAAVIVTPDGHVTELGGGAPHTTNNRMELMGAISALQHVPAGSARIAIYTDSSYVINGITQWVWGWQRRGWKTSEGSDVLNRELWEQLLALVHSHGRARLNWQWVRGHDGTPGNERVDQIAVSFSKGRNETLYDGPLSDYPLAILDLPDTTSRPEAGARKSGSAPKADAGGSRKGPPYSYLSVVDGELQRHATWAECERRVKGRTGARFRKALSPSDEASILRSWGF